MKTIYVFYFRHAKESKQFAMVDTLNQYLESQNAGFGDNPLGDPDYNSFEDDNIGNEPEQLGLPLAKPQTFNVSQVQYLYFTNSLS